MAKINSTKKLIVEDYPKETSWGKIITTLNPFLENVYFALVNGLTLRDNLKMQLNDVKVKNNAFPITIKWTLNERPTSVVIGYIAEDSASPGTIPVHSMQWTYKDGQVEIIINGLDSSKEYLIRIIGQV